MRKSTVWIMAAACGLVVANNYYNQPLLVEFARTFQVTERSAGVVSVLTQFGYAIGMLLFLPLGDMLERRSLICGMLLLATASLVSTALAPSLPWLLASSFAVGFTSIVPQLITPFAAHLAEPDKRGSVIGIVMGGLLAGILLSRTISGFVGAHLGWRTMYWLASGFMLILQGVLWQQLPRSKASFSGNYRDLMLSLLQLIRAQPVLRETSLVAALQFGAFCAFWTTLVFQVYSLPGNHGSSTAGMFGIIGLVGVCIAPYAGRFADRKSPRLAVLIGSVVIVLSFLVLGAAGHLIGGLIAGVILLDMGMQSCHVSNMIRNYALQSSAMSRLNTVYMVTRFLGGAAGSALGNYAWSLWRWPGVCAVGLLLSLLAIALQLYLGRRRPETANAN